MLCLSNANCTITNLDISHNPCGDTLPKAGDANTTALDTRVGVGLCKTMTQLKLNHTALLPTHLVPILGSLHLNHILKTLDLSNLPIDEPSCLQLAHGISVCEMLDELILRGCRMGPKGGAIVLNKLVSCASRFRILDLSDNLTGSHSLTHSLTRLLTYPLTSAGPPSGILLSRLVSASACGIHTLNISQNDIGPEGGRHVALYGLKNNLSLTNIDLSSNLLDESVAIILADAARGIFKEGKLISKCNMKKYCINDNPKIGKVGARELVISLVSGEFEHVEIGNIGYSLTHLLNYSLTYLLTHSLSGAGRSSAAIMAKSMRDVQLTWRYVDISGNEMGRYGLNEIFWALRQNRSIRVFHCGDNKAGPAFASNEYDTLLKHGIALARCLTSNVIIRDLDLSYNGIDSDGGSVIFNAMVDNFVIRRLILRGNRLDDDCSDALCEFIRLNNVVDYLDLGALIHSLTHSLTHTHTLTR
jgi:Ran GTPase-activating protein (RanGAP) involved in mRNA processing and transport